MQLSCISLVPVVHILHCPVRMFTACHAMQSFSDVYPHLRTATDVPTLVKIADVNWDEVDAAFCCLPHATTQETLAQLPKHIKIVDLSADFRLRNVDTYAEW